MATGTKRASSGDGERSLYTEEQKRLVRDRYALCHTREEKLELMQALGMRSLEQLYNLANRLSATRPQQEQTLRADPTASGPFDPARLRMREDPAEATFSARDDAYFQRYFGTRHIEEIAFARDHTESATMWRCRKLGLRRYVKYWPQSRIAAWLDRPIDELEELGIDVYPCTNQQGRVLITLVSTSSILRVLGDADRLAYLRSGDLDEFFLLEMEELREELASETAEWESSRWVSHGHVCMNPYAGVLFGLFDDGSDKKMPGRELHPSDLAPEI